MLLVIGECRVPAHQRDSFVSAAEELGAASRREEGCAFFEFWSDLGATGRFALLEGWESMTHLEMHRGTPHVAAFREATASLDLEMEVARYTVTGHL